jgi:hypothetical protein
MFNLKEEAKKTVKKISSLVKLPKLDELASSGIHK